MELHHGALIKQKYHKFLGLLSEHHAICIMKHDQLPSTGTTVVGNRYV